VIEHVFDPKSVFKAIFKALKPGGCFLGEVPNQDDWRIKIFNDKIVKRFHYDPNHYYYFSPATLKNYLKTSGFNDMCLETVERYNSLLQLRNILCRKDEEKNIEEVLNKYIFPKSQNDEVRLPAVDNKIESVFNRIFEKAMNSELMGNCLRFIAFKGF
jgi:SAM-dependent methyltransferase